MNCPYCHTANCVKNETSRHGHQRWRCPKCLKTFGNKDRRLVAPETKAAALAQYLEGVGQRATERLLGVSHNSITNWVKQAVFGKVLKPTPAEKVEWVEADELWTYIAKKKMIAGSGGLLIVLPNRSGAGRWGSWNRNGPAAGGATASRPPGQVCHRLLAPLRQNLRRPKPCPGQSAHLHHRKPEPPHPVLSGSAQAPDAQRQQVQRKPGRQHPVLHRQQRWRGTGTKNTINTYLAIPDFRISLSFARQPIHQVAPRLLIHAIALLSVLGLEQSYTVRSL